MSRRGRRVLFAGILCLLVLAAALSLLFASRRPLVIENEFAYLDVSDIRVGRVVAAWKQGGDRRVRLSIQKKDGVQYLYELDAGGTPDIFPITEGEGRYTITVYEQTEGTRYLPRLEQTRDVFLRDPDSPFLLPSRPVSFAAGDGVSRLAAELTEGLDGAGERLTALAAYVVDTMTYDTVWAESLQTGYLPVPADVLERGGGNCLDLAALLCALLRAEGIPCRLVVGWAGEEYHAWVSPKVDGAWGHLDPTFLLSGNEEFAGNPGNYRAVYVY